MSNIKYNYKKNSTYELVGFGHPDRVADILAEKILTVYKFSDKTAKVAIEVMLTRTNVILGGEVSYHDKGHKITKDYTN